MVALLMLRRLMSRHLQLLPEKCCFSHHCRLPGQGSITFADRVVPRHLRGLELGQGFGAEGRRHRQPPECLVARRVDVLQDRQVAMDLHAGPSVLQRELCAELSG